MSIVELNSERYCGRCPSCMDSEYDRCWNPIQTDEEAVNTEFISNIFGSIHHPESSTNPEETLIPEETPNSPPFATGSSYTARRRTTKDNIAYKRLSKLMKDCYRTLTGEKVPEEVRKHSYKENYFLMVVTLLEKEGKLSKAEDLFDQAMTRFGKQIEEELSDQPEYLQHLKELIPRHQRALWLFRHSNNPVEDSMKELYDFANMRQKGKFYKAEKEVKELRQQHGLPI
jgi:hypothetical protein